jgi:hypothetical protein|tara:strand:- start:154 stop:327 length:174 start_codon:yes stop_codon:yes gene_type:complete
MKQITLTFNEKEAQVLAQLIDIAVKSEGINVAEAGVFFYKKIQEELESGEVSTEVID